MHETLIVLRIFNFAKEDKNFFVVNPDLRDLNYGKFLRKEKRQKILKITLLIKNYLVLIIQ